MQIDGSHHHWFGEKGPKFTLLLTVDDATGTEAGRTESTVTVSDGALTSSFTVTRNISEQATDLGDGRDFDERHSSTYSTSGETDYYTFSLSKAREVTFALRRLSINLDMNLEGSEGNAISESTNSSTLKVRIQTTLEPGT